MYDDNAQAAQKNPPRCPYCNSEETSYCGTTRHGVAWICSPCCEAFYDESAVTPAGVVTRAARHGDEQQDRSRTEPASDDAAPYAFEREDSHWGNRPNNSYDDLPCDDPRDVPNSHTLSRSQEPSLTTWLLLFVFVLFLFAIGMVIGSVDSEEPQRRRVLEPGFHPHPKNG